MNSLCVVVPVYNVEQYLEDCLASLLRQGIEDLEVILVDDGSTDGSKKIIDKFVQRFPNIFHSYFTNHEGPGHARNTGIQYCTKEYLAFLDSDDYIVDDGYRKILSQMKTDNADMGMFECVWFYPDGTTEERPALPTFLPEFNNRTYILSHASPANKIFKTALWKDTGLRFPERIWYEDLAVIPAFAALTDKITYYRENIYMYRQRAGSIMSTQAYDERNMNIVTACDHIFDLLKNKGFEPELEYLMLFQLCYFSSFRFLKFQKYAEIKQCITRLEEMYPHWQTNSYYQIKPALFRIYCSLLKQGHYKLASLLTALRKAVSK